MCNLLYRRLVEVLEHFPESLELEKSLAMEDCPSLWQNGCSSSKDVFFALKALNSIAWLVECSLELLLLIFKFQKVILPSESEILPSWKFMREEHGSHFEWNVIFLESDKKSSLLGPPQAFKYMRSRWILIGWTFPKTTRTKGDQKSLSRGGWGQKRTSAKSRPAQAGSGRHER